MRLYDEIFKSANGIALSRCLIIPGGGAYFEGVKTVGDFSPQRIVLYFPRETAEIEGENFIIQKYCDGDLQLGGNVFSVRFLNAAAKSNAQSTAQSIPSPIAYSNAQSSTYSKAKAER